MSIRFSLILSYLVLILLMTSGMWVLAHQLAHRLTARNLATAEKGAQRTIDASYKVAEQVLTIYGEKLVETRVEGVARGLAFRMKDLNTSDYAKLRQNEALRKMGTQEVQTPEGPAGFLIVYDRRGEILYHRERSVEGRNSLQWQQEYPEVHELIRRSLTEEKVTGYYTFRDRNNKERRRYTARVHVNGTPFIVAASVNIDEFFLPAQAKIRNACQEILMEARQRIKESSGAIETQVKVMTLVGGIILSVLGGFSGLFFAGFLSRPIARLRDGVKEIGEGNFSVSVPATGVNEVKELAHSFNQLGQKLVEYIEKRDFIRDTFGRYVTQEVVKRLLEDKAALELGGETREVSILMSDLRGFTALIADMSPEQVIILLNRYLGKMIEILLDNRAVIDEIVGDGILAFFGAPEPLEDHALQAVACAMQMQAAMEGINALNALDGLPHLEMGIGVNTGEVVVGNIGSERRTKYSVVGSHVNFTSRIESYALGGQLLVSDSTYQRVKDVIALGNIVEAQMKGIPRPARLYEVQAIGGPYQIRLKKRDETLTALKQRIRVHLDRIHEKIVIGTAADAWITNLSETAALLSVEGEVDEWEDVRLRLLDETMAERPGKIYGKVISVKSAGGGLSEATIRFTSVSPEISSIIRQAVGGA